MKERIQKSEPIQGVKVLSIKTGVKEVISFRASFLAGSRFSQPAQVSELCSRMLMLGTKNYSKEDIAKTLESAAINLNIVADQTRLNISATLPKEKTPLLIELLAELARRPAFTQSELNLLRERIVAELMEAKQDTRTQAWKSLTRELYPRNHHFYEEIEEEEIAKFQKLSCEDLVKFHSQSYGLGAWNVVLAGDVETDEWLPLFAKHLGGWTKSLSVTTPSRVLELDKIGGEIIKVDIKDKASSDVFIASPLDIDVNSRDYFALRLAAHVLGGDFVSRLMQEVREKRGLTYGTNAMPWGVKDGDTGIFYLWGTFAPHLLESGISEMKKVLVDWARGGITAKELTRAKLAMTGNWQVSLADSRGVAEALIASMEIGRGPDFIYEYPKIIQSLSLVEVNSAIKKYIDPKKFLTVAAGSIT